MTAPKNHLFRYYNHKYHIISSYPSAFAYSENGICGKVMLHGLKTPEWPKSTVDGRRVCLVCRQRAKKIIKDF